MFELLMDISDMIDNSAKAVSNTLTVIERQIVPPKADRNKKYEVFYNEEIVKIDIVVNTAIATYRANMSEVTSLEKQLFMDDGGIAADSLDIDKSDRYGEFERMLEGHSDENGRKMVALVTSSKRMIIEDITAAFKAKTTDIDKLKKYIAQHRISSWKVLKAAEAENTLYKHQLIGAANIVGVASLAIMAGPLMVGLTVASVAAQGLLIYDDRELITNALNSSGQSMLSAQIDRILS